MKGEKSNLCKLFVLERAEIALAVGRRGGRTYQAGPTRWVAISDYKRQDHKSVVFFF